MEKVLNLNDVVLNGDAIGIPPSPEFVKSVEEHGVLVPIAVYKGGDKYHVLDGRRRVLAARQIGLAQIPAVLFSVEPQPHMIAKYTLIFNNLRSENPVSEFLAIKSLMDAGFMLDEISDATQLSKATIKKRLVLDNLDNRILQMVDVGEIALGTAELLAKQKESIRQPLTEQAIEQGGITQREIREAKTVKKSQKVNDLPQAVFNREDYQVYYPDDGFVALIKTLDMDTLVSMHATMIDNPKFGKMKSAIENEMTERKN